MFGLIVSNVSYSTTAGYPFCYTRFWNEGSILSELGCVAFPQSLTQTAETTYIGEVPITPTVALTTPSPNPISQSSTSSSSTSSSSTSSSSTPPSSTSPSTVSTSPESTGGDLALGIAAIVGIVIGVIFFCVILCGAGFFCWRAAKRRRNRRPQPPATTFPIDTSQVPPVYNTYNHQVNLAAHPNTPYSKENVRLAHAPSNPREFKELAVRMAEILKPTADQNPMIGDGGPHARGAPANGVGPAGNGAPANGAIVPTTPLAE